MKGAAAGQGVTANSGFFRLAIRSAGLFPQYMQHSLGYRTLAGQMKGSFLEIGGRPRQKPYTSVHYPYTRSECRHAQDARESSRKGTGIGQGHGTRTGKFQQGRPGVAPTPLRPPPVSRNSSGKGIRRIDVGTPGTVSGAASDRLPAAIRASSPDFVSGRVPGNDASRRFDLKASCHNQTLHREWQFVR